MSKIKTIRKPTRQVADQTLTITRVFDAPRRLVFQAWTQPERVKRWWGPKTFTTPVGEIDLRPQVRDADVAQRHLLRVA